MHNTFTYRYSELPSIPAEIQAELVAVDLHVNDLILKSIGNYRSLEQLAEILENCLDSCELNLNSIRIVPDDSPQPSTISLKNLPLKEKQIIYSISRTNSFLLNSLSEIVGKHPQELARDLAEEMSIHAKPVEASEIEEFMEQVMIPLVQQVAGANSDTIGHYVGPIKSTKPA